MMAQSFVGDYGAEQQAIDRRRKIAEMLMQQGQEQPQGGMVGQVYVGASPLQHMAQLLKARSGMEGMRAADEQSRALAGRQQHDLRTTLDEYANAQTPKDKIAALLRNPTTAPKAMEMQAKMDEPYTLAAGAARMGPGGQLASNPKPTTYSGVHYDQQGNAYTLGTDGKPVPLEGVQQPRNVQNVNGVGVDMNRVRPGEVLPQDPNKPFQVGQGGQPAPNSPYQNYEMSKAATGATRVNMPAITLNTEKTYAGNMAEGIAKQDLGVLDVARSAPQRIESAQRIKQALQANPITGTGAGVRLEVEKALATAGVVDPKRVAATEGLVTDMAASTLDAIKSSGLGSGQGFTDKDRQFLQDAKAGRIEMTPQNIYRIADLNERSARQSIVAGKKVADRLQGKPSMGTIGQDMQVEEPAAIPDSAPPSSSPSTVIRYDATGKRIK